MQKYMKRQWYNFLITDNARKKVGEEIAALVKFELGQKFPEWVAPDAEKIFPEVDDVFTINLKSPMIVTCKIKEIKNVVIVIEVINIEPILSKGSPIKIDFVKDSSTF